MLDVGLGLEGSRLLRVDLLRTGILRVVENIDIVEELSGAQLIRSGADRLTFQEVGNKLTDLVRSRLEPLGGGGRSGTRQLLPTIAGRVARVPRNLMTPAEVDERLSQLVDQGKA